MKHRVWLSRTLIRPKRPDTSLKITRRKFEKGPRHSMVHETQARLRAASADRRAPFYEFPTTGV